MTSRLSIGGLASCTPPPLASATTPSPSNTNVFGGVTLTTAALKFVTPTITVGAAAAASCSYYKPVTSASNRTQPQYPQSSLMPMATAAASHTVNTYRLENKQNLLP